MLSQSLFLESPRGLYYRYIVDTELSVRMELNLYDTAAVVLRNHLKPSLARGKRGTAGSGKGVRALLEHFDMSFSYDYNAPLNRADLLFTTSKATVTSNIALDKLHLSSTRKKREEEDLSALISRRKGASIDFDVGRLELFSVPIPLPTAIHPLLVPRPLPCDNQYNAVFSYEDLLFTMSVVNEFLGIKSTGNFLNM